MASQTKASILVLVLPGFKSAKRTLISLIKFGEILEMVQTLFFGFTTGQRMALSKTYFPDFFVCLAKDTSLLKRLGSRMINAGTPGFRRQLGERELAIWSEVCALWNTPSPAS
ncbi:unnamed protein product [Citrullus colocynthis]|uniref:Uncharacterized protein n=1 Tax=Citrullus colocynthis TaxID=252529 RepID=A0ABP0Z6K1_9ROSI